MATQASRQPSHKAEAGEQQPRHRGHPLTGQQSSIEGLLARAAKQQAQEELVIERIEDWKVMLNRVASSADGQLFFKMMLRANNLFTPGVSRDTVRAVEDKQRQDFYLRHVRPYLDKSVRAEFE